MPLIKYKEIVIALRTWSARAHWRIPLVWPRSTNRFALACAKLLTRAQARIPLVKAALRALRAGDAIFKWAKKMSRRVPIRAFGSN